MEMATLTHPRRSGTRIAKQSRLIPSRPIPFRYVVVTTLYLEMKYNPLSSFYLFSIFPFCTKSNKKEAKLLRGDIYESTLQILNE